MTGGNREISQPSTEHRSQPCGHFLWRVMSSSSKYHSDPLQRAPNASSLWLSPESEVPLPCGPAIVREPQEVEGFGTPLATGAAVRHGVPAELDAACLVRVKSQAKFVQPLLQVGAELVRISTGLEACDKVIGIADQYRLALCRPLAPSPVEPEVQYIVEVNICQNWRNYRSLRSAAEVVLPLCAFHDACV